MLFDKPFDFDRFVRLLLWVGGILAAYFLLDKLSSVLIPFLLAWLTAYLLEPIVLFVQSLVRKRIISVLLTLFLIFGLTTVLLILLIPVVSEEVQTLQRLLTAQLVNMDWPSWIPKDVTTKVNIYLSNIDMSTVLNQEGVADKAVSALTGVWDLLSGVFGALSAVFGVVSYCLYLAFIMLDYDRIAHGWKGLVPEKYQEAVFMLVNDMEEGMNGYFKAQTKIVIVVAVLFAICFKIIGLPFAILLGLMLGVINYIPYSQLIGIVPAVALTALHSLETHQNFWMLLVFVLLVFTVVQLIQDLFLTPRFMGEFSGFNPAVILLSLSVWGSLLGLVGVIIAIPLSSILLAYYKRYILDRRP